MYAQANLNRNKLFSKQKNLILHLPQQLHSLNSFQLLNKLQFLNKIKILFQFLSMKIKILIIKKIKPVREIQYPREVSCRKLFCNQLRHNRNRKMYSILYKIKSINTPLMTLYILITLDSRRITRFLTGHLEKVCFILFKKN